MSRVKRDKNDRGKKILRNDSFKMLLDDIREGFSTDDYTTNARLTIVESIERLRLPDPSIIIQTAKLVEDGQVEVNKVT